jgi:hypothetical protein
MAWTVALKESVIKDLRWFGRKDGRLLFDTAVERLKADPLAETRHLKTLGPNPVAQRELRLFGKLGVLFNVDPRGGHYHSRRRKAGREPAGSRRGVYRTP